MLMILIFIIDVYIGCMIASRYVKYNRGMLLEMPDWRLIPGLTVNILVFGFSNLLLVAFYFKVDNQTGVFWRDMLLMTVLWLVYLSFRSEIIRKKFRSFFQSVFRKKEKENENQNDDVQKSNRAYHKMSEAISFVEYTVLYALQVSVLILLIETVIYYVMDMQYRDLESVERFLIIIEGDCQIISVLRISILATYMGMWVTLIRIIAAVKYVENRPQKKNVERIREYLGVSDVKN